MYNIEWLFRDKSGTNLWWEKIPPHLTLVGDFHTTETSGIFFSRFFLPVNKIWRESFGSGTIYIKSGEIDGEFKK